MPMLGMRSLDLRVSYVDCQESNLVQTVSQS
jgi:hypothetical protein